MHMQPSNRYLHVARASDLEGADRRLYRALEMLPATLSVGTLVAFIILSFVAPAIVAYFTIAFSAYWFFKTVFLTLHLRHNFKRLRHALAVNWLERLEHMQYDHLRHLVVLPFYREEYAGLHQTVQALKDSRFPKKQIAIVLAVEERAGTEALEIAGRLKSEFNNTFLALEIAVHPRDIAGEIPGKGSNIAFAARQAVSTIVDTHRIPHEHVIVSAFDADTVVYRDYFGCLTWNFLTVEDPLHASFQPTPLFNNNIWEAPLLSRVLGYSTTFWHMILGERPERLVTFSSHAVPLPALEDVGFWQTNMVSEDSRIFFNIFMRYDGDYRVVPLIYPVSMDANVAPSLWKTTVNLYLQHRRWSYGAENIPYIIFNFIKNPRIPRAKKARMLFVQVEGFWSLVVQPLVLFAFGWLPLFFGGPAFNATVLSYNLPIVSSWFLTVAMLGLVVLAAYSIQLVPQRPAHNSWRHTVIMIAQWGLVPLTMVAFSSIPSLEAQVRLATGKYLGFWWTPKSKRVK